uniref:Uncharacterized protein n=1 Tax=Arundo donax TaxID=35708 RepID=A0A0A8Y2I8_ARUDO
MIPTAEAPCPKLPPICRPPFALAPPRLPLTSSYRAG